MRAPQRALALAIALALSAAPPLPLATAEGPSGATFVIRAGGHTVSGEGTGPADPATGDRTDRRLSFAVRFQPSCAYRTKDPRNQGDWNKLMGITTLDIHGDSVRLGWRWLPAENRMELGLYAYVAGQRVMRALAKVELERWTEVKLRLRDGGVAAEVGKAAFEQARKARLPAGTPTWILRTAYFGGDETAPHDLTIEVRDVASS